VLPSPAADRGGAADSSSLLASFLQAGDADATPVAVGVVRGRGVSNALKEASSTAERSDVETRVRAAVDSIEPAVASSSFPSAKEVDAAPLKHIQHNDITLASDADRLAMMAKLASSPKHRVLAVYPSIDHADVAKCRTLVDTGSVSVWNGSALDGCDGARLVFTTVSNLLVFLKLVKKTAKFVFSHIVFAGCVHAGRTPASFDMAIAMLRDEIRNTKREDSARVVICGATRDDFAGYFDPLRCAEVSPQGAREGDVTVFTADEAAALCDVSLKTPATSAIPRGPTTAAEAIHPKLVEHATDTARLLVELLVDNFDTKVMRAVVFAPDSSDFEAAMARHGLDEKADVSKSLSALQGPVSRHTIVVLPHSMGDHSVRGAHANVMIDLGLEKRLVAAPPAEATMPLRLTVRATARETASRLHVLGWHGAGVAFHVLAGPPASGLREEDPLHSISRAVLGALRADAPASAIREGHFRAAHAHSNSVDSSLALLTEQCAIVSAQNPAPTFIGDLLGRLPLPVDSGMIAVHGLALGLIESFTAVAVALSVDIFGHCPVDMNHSQWHAKVTEHLRSTRSAPFSDVLAAAHVIVDAAIGGASIADLSARTGAPVASLELAVSLYSQTAVELRDYCFFGAVSADAAHKQLDDHISGLTYIIAVCAARNAVVVRAEADNVKQASERGRMILQRTAKDVTRNVHHPTAVEWKTGEVVVAGNVMNTHSKLIVSHCTTLSHSGFHAALLLLHPALSFDVVADGVVQFCANVNRNPKRLQTDVDTTAKVLDFREKWSQLLGVAQLKRSMPRNTTQQQFNAFLTANNRKLDVASLRGELLSALQRLTQELETSETQAAPQLSRTHLLAPAEACAVAEVALGGDEVVLKGLLAGQPSSKAGRSAAAADDDVEVEGAVAAPIIEDDVEVEGAEAAPIMEED
jgi:hypothetical protein